MVVANMNIGSGVELSVLVDTILNPPGAGFTTLLSTAGSHQISPVEQIADAEIHDQWTSRGTVHAIRVALAPGEARILARPR